MLCAVFSLGKAVIGAEEGDKGEVQIDDGHGCRALIAGVGKSRSPRQ